MSTSSSAPVHTPHTPIGRVLAIAAALAVVVGVVVLAFAWPSVTAEPHNLPVAVAGPEQSVTALEDAVQAKQPDVLAFQTVDDRDAAVTAIEKREVYGAIILGAAPGVAPEVLTSSAANLAVSQLLTGIASALGRLCGSAVTLGQAKASTTTERRAASAIDRPRTRPIGVCGLCARVAAVDTSVLQWLNKKRMLVLYTLSA